MNCAPLSVPKQMSASRTHSTFVTLGLRHLCIVNKRNRVTGIITRVDLENAANGAKQKRSGPVSAVLTSAAH
jgi:CBS domain-containing protein